MITHWNNTLDDVVIWILELWINTIHHDTKAPNSQLSVKLTEMKREKLERI